MILTENVTSNIILFQNFDGFLTLMIVFFHIILSTIMFMKIKRNIILFINLMFSVILGIASFDYWIPLQTYLVIFDILINVIFFAYGIGLAKDL